MLALLVTNLAVAADWPIDDDTTASWSTLPSGVEVQDVVVGTGATVVDRAGAEVHYTGMLDDGTVFDTSLDRDETLTFRIGDHGVIQGWEDGVVGMSEGGTRRLMIPPSAGYGAKSVGPIPANSVLYFEVQLVAVTAPRTAPSSLVDLSASAYFERGAVRVADVVGGTGSRARPGQRVCIDYVVFQEAAVIEETYDRRGCTWLRLDGEDLPEGVELGLKKMRAGGTRRIELPSGAIYQVELHATGK